MTFGGATYSEARDGDRLRAQLARVRALVAGGGWWTLADLEAATGDPQASISARLRDLRKARHGGWIVERRYLGGGLWEYRASPPQPVQLGLPL